MEVMFTQTKKNTKQFTTFVTLKNESTTLKKYFEYFSPRNNLQ